MYNVMFGFFLFEYNFRFQFMEISVANETTFFGIPEKEKT